MARGERVEDWASLLTENPKVLWGIVADVVKAAKAGEQDRKTGRRPAVSVSSLDELYEILFPPSYADQPFPEAFTYAMRVRNHSQHSFAAAVGFNQATVSRLVSGRAEPTVELMERIARALQVRPTYFAEYRALKLGQLVTEVLLADPSLSADSLRRLFGAPV
jgi:transcriptional regulator with XRE-family HTH domain